MKRKKKKKSLSNSFLPFPFLFLSKFIALFHKFLFETALSNTSSLAFPPPQKKKKKVGRFEGIHWPRSASVIDFRSVIKPFREDSKWHCAKNSPSGRRSTTIPPSQQHRLSLSANYFSPLSRPKTLLQLCFFLLFAPFPDDIKRKFFSLFLSLYHGPPRARLPIDHPPTSSSFRFPR